MNTLCDWEGTFHKRSRSASRKGAQHCKAICRRSPGRKLGEEACPRGDSGLRGCWCRMGVGPRGHRGEAGPTAEMLPRDWGWEGLHLGRTPTYASGIRLHPSLPAPLPIFPHFCFSSHFTLFLSQASFIWDFSCFFSHFLFSLFSHVHLNRLLFLPYFLTLFPCVLLIF